MITETMIDVRYPDCDRMGIVHHAVYADVKSTNDLK